MNTEASRDYTKTFLYDEHVALKAKMSPFAGYMMPIYYDSVLKEHAKVRTSCGMFDVSHMGQILVSGPKALSFLQYLTISDVSKLTPHKSQYSAMLTNSGKVIDDIFIYMLDTDYYMVCVNASNKEKDYNHFLEVAKNGFNDLKISLQKDYSLIAVQGPESKSKVYELMNKNEKILGMNFSDNYFFDYNNEKILIARTGYTGEIGFEIFCPNSVAKSIWETLYNNGVSPIGLGARDTLRLESCFLLYGNDMDETVSPLEAGISWAIKKDSTIDYIGKSSIDSERGHLARKTIAFNVEGGIARHGMNIYKKGSDQIIGTVTSGSFLPTLNLAGGMARINTEAQVNIDDLLEVDIRGKRKALKVVKKPLYVSKNK